MTFKLIDDGLWCIDLQFQGRDQVIAAYLLEDAGERALIEIGPTSTLDILLKVLVDNDFDPDSISRVLVTHIHLDHAGAAGSFLRRFPRSHLFVHEVGAPHLADPSRLVASATRIYGDLMDVLWGVIEPVPPARMTPLADCDTVTIGRRSLRAIYTPGHASHHVIYHEEERSLVFAGDAAAVRMPGVPYVRPATPPPDLDLSLWDSSLERIRALNPRALCLTHFGPFADVDDHISQARRRLAEWGAVVRSRMDEEVDPGTLEAALRHHGDRELLTLTSDPQMLERYELASPYGMSADGYRRYWKKLSTAIS